MPIEFGCVCLHEAQDDYLLARTIGARSIPAAASIGIAEHAHIPIDDNGISKCLRGQLVYEPMCVGASAPARVPSHVMRARRSMAVMPHACCFTQIDYTRAVAPLCSSALMRSALDSALMRMIARKASPAGVPSSPIRIRADLRAACGQMASASPTHIRLVHELSAQALGESHCRQWECARVRRFQ